MPHYVWATTRLVAGRSPGRVNRLPMSDKRIMMSDNLWCWVSDVDGTYSMERINVRVDSRLKEELEAAAEAEGARPSELVRSALEAYLRGRSPGESCLDVARRAGVVGVYRNTPRDLSTNPKHMEGFGG